MANHTRTLRYQLRHLERALAREAAGQEYEWAQRVTDALHGLLGAMRHHAAESESQDVPIDQTRPTLARQADGLRREHRFLLAQVIGLCEQVRNAQETFEPPAPLSGPPAPAFVRKIPDFGALRRQANQLVHSLRRHEERETDLVLESVTTDIGVGD